MYLPALVRGSLDVSSGALNDTSASFYHSTTSHILNIEMSADTGDYYIGFDVYVLFELLCIGVGEKGGIVADIIVELVLDELVLWIRTDN
jgi:hypothetical protein